MAYDDRLKLTQGADESYTAYANCSAADPLVLAILTFKNDINDPDPGALQKKITTSFVAGVGQITADGSTTGGAAVPRFDFTAAQTACDEAGRAASPHRVHGKATLATICCW